LLPVPGLAGAVQAFLSRLLPPRKNTAEAAFFPTPAGATWRDVSIRFVDGHTIAIRVRSVTGTLNYTQMGMASRRNGRPTKQWELLQAFAENGGSLTWKSRQADRRNQKRKELLAEGLRVFFRIQGEPFQTDGKGWRTVFSTGGQ
jgi:hypothetical protein